MNLVVRVAKKLYPIEGSRGDASDARRKNSPPSDKFIPAVNGNVAQLYIISARHNDVKSYRIDIYPAVSERSLRAHLRDYNEKRDAKSDGGYEVTSSGVRNTTFVLLDETLVAANDFQ